MAVVQLDCTDWLYRLRSSTMELRWTFGTSSSRLAQRSRSSARRCGTSRRSSENVSSPSRWSTCLRPPWWSSCECKPNLKRMRGRPRFSSLKRRRRNASSKFGQRPHMYSESRPDSGPSSRPWMSSPFKLEFYGRTDNSDGPVMRWIKKELTELQRRSLGVALHELLEAQGVGVCKTGYGRQLSA